MSSNLAGEPESKRIATAGGEERVPYEGILRSIGLYLDEQGEETLLTTARARRVRVQDRRWGIRLFNP